MSCAYQYGVETTAQPAAIAKVSAPEAICSRLRYGVTNTSVAASRSRDLVDREEAVVELDVVVEPELEDAPLEHQPVPLALAPRDVGMGATGDHVGDLRVALDDRGQRLDHRLEALSRRDQPEGREQEPVRPWRAYAPESGSSSSARRASGETRRRAVRHDPDLLSGQTPDATSSRSAVSVITMTSSACSHSSVEDVRAGVASARRARCAG